MKELLYSILILLLVSSCDEVIELDIDQAPPVPVIEAQFTNMEERNYVKITRSTSFYEGISPPPIRDAVVRITGSDGSQYDFLNFAGNDPDSAAFYFPAAPVKGQVDISYTLEITVDGNTVTAQDLMPPVAPVDSMLALIDPEEQADPAEEGEFYEVLVFTTEPQDRKDFYMFRFYKNFQRTRQSPEDIYIADDLVLGEKISGVPIPFYFAERDTATIEMYGISHEAFVYYTDLQAVMNSDGGLFSPPPANPRTNLQGGVLGFFLVASIQSDTLVIE